MKLKLTMLNRIKKEIHEWIDAIISNIPGSTGNLIRRYWYVFRFKFKKIVMIERGCEFIDPTNISFLDNGISIGKNCFFTAEGGEIIIDSKTSFNRNVHINASVGGQIKIGKHVLIGPNCVMRTSGHIFLNPNMLIQNQGHTIKNIIINDDVWLGSNVVVLGGVDIGKGSVIGAGAVVINDIPEYAIAVGVPAKVIKYRK